jgi:hypothetical protein
MANRDRNIGIKRGQMLSVLGHERPTFDALWPLSNGKVRSVDNRVVLYARLYKSI